MYKKVSVVLGALALMVAIGFGSSPSYAEEDEGSVIVCHGSKSGKFKTITVSEDSSEDHVAHGDNLGACA